MTLPAGRIFLAPFLARLIAASGLYGFEFAERSVSPSGQFVIYGADAGSRGAVSALAERAKTNLLSLLKESDGWKIAIVINLQMRAVNVPEMPATTFRFSQTETGPKFQVDLTLSQKITPAGIERELVQVILIEMIYRDQTRISAGDVFVEPPSWLIDGLIESGQNRDRASLAACLLIPAGPPTLAEFLNQCPETFDSTGRQLHRAYSFVLVQMLLDTPTGASRLGRYLENLASAPNDPLADLQASFPEMSDLENAWKVKMAELTASLERQLLTFSQTDEKLKELLNAPLWNDRDRPVSFENIALVKPNAGQRTALREFSRKLLLLATRANPVLRPVIQDYQQIADQLALGRTRGLAKRLTELKSSRAQISARMNDVDDYLNWFEAAKMQRPSGMFEDSVDTADRDSPKPKRRDALSIYLDAMELEF